MMKSRYGILGGRSVCLIILMLFFAMDAACASTLNLPRNLKIIETKAFRSAKSLDEVHLPEGMTRIESEAFAENSLKKIYLPTSLTYIADDAFDHRNNVVGYGYSKTYAARFFEDRGWVFVRLDEQNQIPVTKISFDGNETQVIGTSVINPDVLVQPSNASDQTLNWYSTNTKVASLGISQQGEVSVNMVGIGEADIIAEAKNGVKGKWHIKVTSDPSEIAVNRVVIDDPEGEWWIGDGITGLSATVYPTNATNTALQWKSTNEKVATVSVSKRGIVSVDMVGLGSADIIAEASNGIQGKWYVKVVPEVKPIPVTKVKILWDRSEDRVC